ncbi:hypothetical protein TSAR_007877, partial [Trichomalopsis sarcophagae]
VKHYYLQALAFVSFQQFLLFVSFQAFNLFNYLNCRFFFFFCLCSVASISLNLGKKGLHARLLFSLFLRRSRLSRRKIIVVIYVYVKDLEIDKYHPSLKCLLHLLLKLHKKTFKKSSNL